MVKGSVRSNGEISIHSLMEGAKENFISYGGHEMAGGFEVDFDKIHFLEKELNLKYPKAKKILKEKRIIDMKISIDEVNFKNMNEMKKLSPFGVGNKIPLFLLENIEIFRIKIFGKGEEHLELLFRNSQNQLISAVKFFYKDSFGEVKFQEGQKINLVAVMEENNFLGNTNLRLRIEDIF